MGDVEADEPGRPNRSVLLSLLPSREFASTKKGALLIAEVVLSFVSFVLFAASEAAAFVTVPLVEFLAAIFLLFDFLRCVTASIVFFVVSIIAVSKYIRAYAKAAGIFGFIATIVFALDFYLLFTELITFLKEGGETNAESSRDQDEFSDSDSD
uniref:Uncharacterized protein n=1 Tax=Mola mola TaxID=94237 RepID=A0A3Q3X585_MOLML